MKKGVGSGSISQRYGSGSAPKCHGSPTQRTRITKRPGTEYLGSDRDLACPGEGVHIPGQDDQHTGPVQNISGQKGTWHAQERVFISRDRTTSTPARYRRFRSGGSVFAISSLSLRIIPYDHSHCRQNLSLLFSVKHLKIFPQSKQRY
jgi:hypothetical protein